MKCPNCGTKYEGSRCPDCGRHTDPRDEAKQRNRKFILITAGIIVVIAIFTVSIYIKLDYEAKKAIDGAMSELDAIQQQNEEIQPVNSVSSTKTEDADQPEIVSSINDYLDDSWGGEASAKMNGDGLSIVICAVGEIPDFLDAAQTVATSVTNMAAEADISTCVVTVKQSLDSSAQILLTFINGKLSYRADEAEEYKPTNDAYITLDEYNLIQNGMSYQEVVNIIGGAGTQDFDMDYNYEDVVDIDMSSYSWSGKNEYSSATVVFTGGAVTGKSQFGLE